MARTTVGPYRRRLRAGRCTSSTCVRCIENHSHNDADVVNLSSVELFVRIELLHLLRERSISSRILTGRLGFSGDGDGQHCLQTVLPLFGDASLLRQPSQLFPNGCASVTALPSLEPCHIATDNLQEFIGAEVVPYSVRRKYQDIAMADIVAGDAGVLWEVAQGHATKDARTGEDLGWDDGQLVGCVKGMGLGVRIIMDGVEAELRKAGVT